MVRSEKRWRRHPTWLVPGALAAGMALVWPAVPAAADVAAVVGSAYGYYSNVSLFGGPASAKGPAPNVTLPAAGSPTPVTDSVAEASAVYGPAVLFKSGAIEVSAQGRTGAEGSATTSVTIAGVDDGPGPFLYQGVKSTCTASEAGRSGSTQITGGRLETKYNADTQEATEVEDVPASPPANYERTGTIDHVGDNYRIVFNEQIANADGTLTVNAAHMYLLGPIAVGELIIGQSVCGAVSYTHLTLPTKRIV